MSFVRNIKIEKILTEWKKESHAKRSIHYWYNSIQGDLTICSSEVGRLIGYHGNLVNKYQQILKEQLRDIKEVKFQEVNYHWI